MSGYFFGSGHLEIKCLDRAQIISRLSHSAAVSIQVLLKEKAMNNYSFQFQIQQKFSVALHHT